MNFTKYFGVKDIIKTLSPGACQVLLLLIQNNNLLGNNALVFRNTRRPIKQKYIADTLNLGKSRVSKLFSELENHGVIAKGNIDNTRCYYLNPDIATTKKELTAEDLKTIPVFKQKNS